MEEYIQAQLANLEIGRRNRFFQTLVPAGEAAYRAAIDALPRDGVPMFGRILLICYKSMLSAAVLIAKLQPEDSVGITRRALEAARFAVAMKINPQNALQWTAYQERHDRWLRRREGKMPGRSHPSSPTCERMRSLTNSASSWEFFPTLRCTSHPSSIQA
jgi:hypothetical protein